MATKPDPNWEPVRAHGLPVQARTAPSPRIHCRSWHDLCERIDEWDRLAGQASEPNPFFESWYLLPALRAFPEKRLHMLCFEQDGQLRGLLPIQFRYHYYGRPIPHLATWIHENCFLGAPLVAAGAEVAFWRAVLDWADANAGHSLFLHLRKLPTGGPLHAALEAVATSQMRRCEMVLREHRALLASQLSPQRYWEASLSAKKRKELRRQANRLAELGAITYERTTGIAGLERWTEDFLSLEAAGWKGDAGSSLAASQSTAQLFRESLEGAAQRGKLERLTLALDSRPVAMLANFLAPPGAFSFKTTYDEQLARFSPGVLLQQHNLAMLDRPDIAWCDSCASADHPMIDHIWRERRAMTKVSVAIGGRLRRAIFDRLADIETTRSPHRDQP